MAFFSSGKEQQEEGKTSDQKISMLANGIVIDGNVMSEGDLRVEGKIIGTLVCRAKLVVGTSGKIEGNVDAQNATISGEVNGSVIVRDVLQLQESACVNGDVVTEKMNMQTGSVITGQIKMGKEAAQIIKQEPNIEQFQGIAELQNQIQENGKGRPAGHLEEGGAPPEAKQTGE